LAATVVIAGWLAMSPAAHAADSAGHPANSSFISFDLNDRSSMSTNVLTGNLIVQASDLSIKGVGQDPKISRVYNSQDNTDSGFGSDGSFGPHWRAAPLDARVGNETQYRDQRTFDPGDGTTYVFRGTPADGYDSPAGIDADLEEDQSSGTVDTLTFRASQTKWTFGADGNLAVADRNGNTVHYYGGDAGTTIATDTQGRAITAVRNASSVITKITDPTSRHSDYAYGTSGNALNRLATYTDASGNATTYGYDSSGRLNKVTTAGGRITKVTYDTAGRVATVNRVNNNTAETGDVTTYSYGQTDSRCANSSSTTGVTKVTDARGGVTSYCPSTTDLSAADVIDPLGHHKSATYDSQGHITAQGTGSSLTTTGYNANGTMKDQTQPAGEKTTWSYSGSGAAQYQPSSTTDPDQHSQFFGYDGAGNLTSVANNATAANATLKATLTYNANGTISTAKDGENRQTNYGYFGTADGVKNGYLKTVTPPTVAAGMTQPGVTTLNYDALGHVTTATDGRGKVTTYTYDALDRTKTITFDGGSSLTYTYDADGNQTQRVDSSGGTYTYSYDKQNRRTHEGLPGARAVDYTYDAVGNLKTLQDGSSTTLYGFDAASQPCFVATTTSTTGTCASPPTGATTFTYDALGNRTQTTYPNGVTVTAAFDASHKPQTISAKKNGAVIDDRSYTYNSYPGTPTANGSLLASQSYPHDGGSWTYGYNAAGQLDTAVRPDPYTGDSVQTDFTYDKAGNRTLAVTQIYGTQDDTSSFVSSSYNAANQLCTMNATTGPGCGTSSSSTLFAYDAGGNDLRFGYNDRNQTVSGGGSLAYGGPNQFELTADAGTTIENNLLGVGRKINGTNITTYTRDTDGTLLYRTGPGGTKEYVVEDAQGSIIDLTSTTGTRTATYKYDPDGNKAGPDTPTDFGYTGSYLRGGTSPIYHNGLRWYDPKTARWTQPDPLDQPDDLQNANRYVYAGADPINFLDLLGLAPRGSYCERNQHRDCTHGGRGSGVAKGLCASVIGGAGYATAALLAPETGGGSLAGLGIASGTAGAGTIC
jgi:RHS repeat-associated protein